MKFLLTVSMAVLVGSSAMATPVLNGVIDPSYGAAQAVQTVETGFGDNLSELDAAYAVVDSGVLYLMLTGQLEDNFNRLNIFIDSITGGQNQLQNDANNGGNNPQNDGWAMSHAGMTFDKALEADYMLILRNGNFPGDRFDIDYAVIGGGLGAFQSATDIFGGSLTGVNGGALPNGIGVGYDNSNTMGITGGTGAANQAAALAVLTGIELAIPLSAIGNPNPQDILISAMINIPSHNYLSNQFLGGLPPPQGNLGGDGNGGFTGNLAAINLNGFAGDQFFEVGSASTVPEPSTVLMVGLGLVCVAARRRQGHRT